MKPLTLRERIVTATVIPYMLFMGIWPWLALPLLAFAVSDLVSTGQSPLGLAWLGVSALWVVLVKFDGPQND